MDNLFVNEISIQPEDFRGIPEKDLEIVETHVRKMLDLVSEDTHDAEKLYVTAGQAYYNMLNQFMEHTLESDLFSGYLRYLSMLAFRNSDVKNALKYTRYSYQIAQVQMDQYLAIYDYVTITSCIKYGDYVEHVSFLRGALNQLFVALPDNDFVWQFAMLYRHSTRDIRAVLTTVYHIQMAKRNQLYCEENIRSCLENSGYADMVKKLM